MPTWLQTDWAGIFRLKMSLPEILIRGTLVYLSLILMLRIILKRQAGKVSLSDLLVVTLVAGVCRNPLVRDAYSIPDGILVVATVLLWSYALDWLSFKVPIIHKLLHPPPVLLIQDGRILEENLRHELITKNQLESKLRCEGVGDPKQVGESWLEGNGNVSVVRRDGGFSGPRSLRPGTEEGGLPVSTPSLSRVPQPGTQILSSESPECAVRMNGRQQGAGEETRGSENFSTLAEGVEPGVRGFLEAAEKLQGTVAWHQGQMAEHQQAIAQIKELLNRHGFRFRSRERRG